MDKHLQVFYSSKSPNKKNIIKTHADFYEISYCLEGELVYTIGNETYCLNKMSLILIRKGVPHSFFAKKGHTTCSIMFTDKFLGTSFFEERFQLNILDIFSVAKYLNLKNNTIFRAQFEMLVKKIKIENRKDLYSFLKIRNYIIELLILVREYANINSKGSTVINLLSSVEEFTRKNYFKPISLNTIAAEFGVSCNYLGKIFKSHYALYFRQYLNQLRLEECKRLLKDKTMSIVSVCFEIGFNDLSHFNRTFKQYLGLTPTQYRKNLPS